MTTGALTTIGRDGGDLVSPSTALPVFPPMTEPDRASLRRAVVALERQTLAGRLSTMAGRPLEMIGHALPESARAVIAEAVEAALGTALRVALRTLPKIADAAPGERSLAVGRPARSGRLHTVLAAASGAFGGALGLVTLPVELPVSTTLVLRAIAEIAREEGENLARPETSLACMQVFALGSRTEADDLASSGYFAVRGALAKSISEAAKLAAGRGFSDRSAPALVRFIGQIASRFGIVVSQKVAAGAIPIVGAIGGAAVNAAFMEHFRTVARAHFTVRRLEREYGQEAVRGSYEAIRTEIA